MRHSTIRFVYVALGLVAAMSCLGGATAQQSVSGSIEDYSADTSSPRTTLFGFIESCNEMYDRIKSDQYFSRKSPEHLTLANRILDCLDQRDLPEFARIQRASEVAICIKEIIDRIEIPPLEQVPDSAEIEARGGAEKLSQYRIPGSRLTIARVEEGPQKHEYLFTRGTVDRAVGYFESLQHKPYRSTGPATSPGLYDWFLSAPGHSWLSFIHRMLPENIRDRRIFTLALWKWLGVVVAIVVAAMLLMLIYRWQFRLTDRAKERNLILYWLTLAFPVLANLVPGMLQDFVEDHLTVRSGPLYYLNAFCVLLQLITSTVLIFALVKRIAETIIASPKINPAGLNAQLIRITSRLASVIGTAGLFLYGGQYLGIPVGTLLASAGIGGVALALGAQDTLKTLFGTVTLMADKPFRIGERIVTGNYDGVVEDIGLRSTRVRLLTGNLVSIPNDQLANSHIENVGHRPHIRRKSEIRIPIDCSLETVQQAVEIVRSHLQDDIINSESHPPRVFLHEFAADAFVIRFYYWYSPPDYWAFKEFSERVNFDIFSSFEQHEIPFSLPKRWSYWKKEFQQGTLEVSLSDHRATGA